MERSVGRFARRGPVHPSQAPNPFSGFGAFGGGAHHGEHSHPHAPPAEDAFSPALFYADGQAEMPSPLHKVLAKSAFGVGTTVTITLPAEG